MKIKRLFLIGDIKAMYNKFFFNSKCLCFFTFLKTERL